MIKIFWGLAKIGSIFFKKKTADFLMPLSDPLADTHKIVQDYIYYMMGQHSLPYSITTEHWKQILLNAKFATVDDVKDYIWAHVQSELSKSYSNVGTKSQYDFTGVSDFVGVGTSGVNSGILVDEGFTHDVFSHSEFLKVMFLPFIANMTSKEALDYMRDRNNGVGIPNFSADALIHSL